MDTKQRKTHQMTLRLRHDLIERVDQLNQLKYHGTRSRTSLITEAIWTFIELKGLGNQFEKLLKS